ncbi:MAG: hypothetical protein JXQ72_16530 [Anaerolineae bacterium]|nr:hypothetical protein [Anaerolineae bacterium]
MSIPCLWTYLILVLVLALAVISAWLIRWWASGQTMFSSGTVMPPAEWYVEYDQDDPDATGKRFIGVGQ